MHAISGISTAPGGTPHAVEPHVAAVNEPLGG